MTGGKIGFIGLGAMGSGQSKNLMLKGFSVRGYDIDKTAMERFAACGGAPARSPADAADDADLLVVLVFTAAQAEEVLFGREGAVASLPDGKTVVLHTTGRPEDARSIARRLADAGHPMLDAPVTGGKAGADAGTLTAIVSGPDEAFAAARTALEAMCARITRVGPDPGAASAVKMVNQLLVGIHGVAMAEALALAVKAGADPHVVYDVITHGVGNSAVFEKLAPFVLAGDFSPRGATAILIKDLGAVAEAAGALGLELPVATAALAKYREGAEMGLERADFTSVARVYERQTGIDMAAAAKDSGNAPHDSTNSPADAPRRG